MDYNTTTNSRARLLAARACQSFPRERHDGDANAQRRPLHWSVTWAKRVHGVTHLLWAFYLSGSQPLSEPSGVAAAGVWDFVKVLFDKQWKIHLSLFCYIFGNINEEEKHSTIMQKILSLLLPARLNSKHLRSIGSLLFPVVAPISYCIFFSFMLPIWRLLPLI